MNFTWCSDELKASIKSLTADAEFQKIYGDDEVLDELDAEKTDLELEKKLLEHILLKKEHTGMTLGKWSFLWSRGNKVVSGGKKGVPPDFKDVIEFLYLMKHPLTEFDEASVAKAFAEDKLDLDELFPLISKEIRDSFYPLTVFPKQHGSSCEVPNYGIDWLTMMATMVHSVTGFTTDYIIHEMSLLEACAYFVQYRRINGTDKLERRTDQEILARQDERSCEIIADYLIVKGWLDKKERAEFVRNCHNRHK